MHASAQVISEEQLIRDYSNLIHYAIRKFYPYRYDVEYEDLFQIGSIALLRAYRTFNPDRGASFTTYALLNLRSALYGTIRSHMAQKRKGRVISLDAVRNDSDFCLMDTITDEKAAEAFDAVLLKICISEGSYTMPEVIRRTVKKPTLPGEEPVITTLDLSKFMVFDASNSTSPRGISTITITKDGRITLSSAVGAQYQANDKLEILINQPANIVVVRKADNGMRCRPNGKNTTGKLIRCKALVNSLKERKMELPIRFRAEWDKAVQGFVGKR